MKLFRFRFDDTVESYKYPIVKLLVSVIFICTVLYVRAIKHWGAGNEIADFLVGIICAALMILAMVRIAISLSEIQELYEKLKKDRYSDNAKKVKTVNYSINDILSMMESNDIIEIRIYSKGKAIDIGSSSDSDMGKRDFFDKVYFIEKKEYKLIDDIKSELIAYSEDGKNLSVFAIDGVNVNKR